MARSERSSLPILRVSIRGLMLLLLAVALWLGYAVQGARRQQRAVEEIRQAGGIVFYDWEFSNEVSHRLGRPWAPQLAIDIVGQDYFGYPTGVILAPGSHPDTAAIGRLSRLQSLSFYSSKLTDAELAPLASLRELTHLRIEGNRITDSCLVHLGRLSRLKWLALGETRVSDAGLKRLATLKNLHFLDLTGTCVTEDGIKRLLDERPKLGVGH